MAQREASNFHIPLSEISVTFARSSGAGGQNVNKTSTKVAAHWPVGRSRFLTAEEKARVRTKLANRINNYDEVTVTAESERSQLRNRTLAVARLQALVNKALQVPKYRRPTRPTRGSKIRRIETKKIRSRVKASRRARE